MALINMDPSKPILSYEEMEAQKNQAQPEATPQQPQQQQAQPEQPEQPKPQAQQPEPQQSEPEAAPQQKEVSNDYNFVDQVAAIPLGVGDFVADMAGFVGFKKADQWWDENSSRNNNPWIKGTRDLAATVIPTLVGGYLAKGAGGKIGAKFLPNLGKKQKFFANVAAELGADAGVAGINSQTSEGGNIAGAFNETFGTNIPWGTTAADSPDAQFAMNMAENTAVGGLAELVSGFLGARFRGAYKIFKAGTDIRTSSVGKNVVKSGDEALDAAIQSQATIKKNQIEEGAAHLRKDPEGKEGYNGYTNVPSEDVAKPAQGRPADPVGAKADQTLISTNTLTTDGVPRPMTTEGFRRAMANSTSSKERRALLESIFAPFSEKIDVVAGGKKFTAETIEKSADQLRDFVFEMEPGQFEEVAEIFTQNLYEGQKILDRKGFAVFEKTFRRAFDELIDPKRKTASAFVTQEAAVNAGMAAKAARITGTFANPESQGQKVLQNLHILAKEMRFNQFVSGQMLADKNIIKNFSPAEMAEYLTKKQGMISEAYEESAKKTKVFFDEMAKIQRENPLYLRPFYEIFEATKYEANTFAKMINHMENRTGVIGKAFVDGKPQVPSYLVKELESLRYNQVLFGKAIINTFGGNTMNLMLKPINTFAGSLVEGNTKEAMFAFGGIQETLSRGFTMMKKDWNLVTSDPASLKNLARTDIQSMLKNQAEFDAIENLMDVIRKSGDQAGLGRVMAWNLTKMLSYINKTNFARFGVNSMTALDGMVKGINASWMARKEAYRELAGDIDKLSPDAFKAKFNEVQKRIYNEAFDDAGNMTNKAAEYASKEMTLQLDNGMADTITKYTQMAPFLKPLFLFPRTGANALDMAWSYTPTSALLPGIGKANRVFNAETVEEIASVLGEHGIKSTDRATNELAIQSLRGEYRGRQLMGSAVLTSAALWAANGNLRGSGSSDQAEARRMRLNLNWEPFTIRSPIDGEWYSYQNFEPFSKILGLVADFTYESTRVDQQVSERFFQKLMYSISSNVTNATFASGLEPLVKLIAGDGNQWTKLMARETDTLLNPIPRGVRSILNNVIMPQVIDVENDFKSEMMRQNKWLFGPLGQLDQYNSVMDGKPINYLDPMNASINALLPLFKLNGDQSPQQEYLTSIAWTGLSDPRSDLITQQELSPKRRQWINNWIAENQPLNPIIDKMMAQDKEDGYWRKKIKEFRKGGQGVAKKDWQIKRLMQHQILSNHMNKAYKQAFNALALQDPDLKLAGQMKQAAQKRIERNDVTEAQKLQQQATDLLKMNK